MKKNYLNLLLALTCFAGLVGCNVEQQPSESASQQPSAPESEVESETPSVPEGPSTDTVLADAVNSWHVAGNNEVLTDGAWVGNAWDCTDANSMKAASIADVTALDAELGAALAAKDVKYLYTTEVRLGVADAGWAVKAMINGQLHEQNGSYAVKAIKGSFDEEDGNYIQDLWLPDPHKAHAESLTPETLFIPSWTEAKDENGFSWADNPVCIGEGGVYTLVVSQYNNVSSATEAGFGFALVLKEAAENALPHTNIAPLADPLHTWHVAGNNEVYVGDAWTANAWDCTDSNKMTAVNLAAINDIDADLAATLATKEVKYLYTTEVRLGVTAANWEAKAMIDGKLHVQDGSYAIKAIQGSFDEEDEVYIQDLWLPDPHKAHAESLTPETLFMPVWTEAKDQNGFSWSDNPVCIGEGGVYTLVVAQYTNISAADAPGFGFALVLKEAAEEALPHTEYVAPAVDSYGVIGSFADNNWSSDKLDLVAGADGKHVGSLALDAGVQFKVRMNDEWTTSYGYADLENAADLEGVFADNGGNIECLVAGEYTISFDPTTQLLTITTKAPDTYGIIGSFADNNWASDVQDLVAVGDGTYAVTLTLEANVEFKLRVNDDWTVSYGSGSVANAADLEGLFELGEGGANIKCLVAGTYVITFDPATETLTITAAE